MLINHFVSAYRGRILWDRLEKKYHADLYILMPKSCEDYNYYALLHLNKYIESKRAENVVILTFDEGVKKAKPLFEELKKVGVINFQRKQALDLIKYYALYEFSTKLTIISLTEPYDTCGENLLGIKGVTKEDLLCFDIYRFSEVPKIEAPLYDGEDRDVINFISTNRE